MIVVDLLIGSRYPVNRRLIRERIQRVLSEHRISHGLVAISVVGKRKIQALNEQLLNHEGVTDVLSFPQQNSLRDAQFPLPEGVPPHLGDIVICFPVAVSQARRYGKRVDDQLCFYAEHGLLHLLGYHHEE